MDTDRIKNNIDSMIKQNASEAEIDQYVASEGTTAEALRTGQTSPKTETGTAGIALSPNQAGEYGQLLKGKDTTPEALSDWAKANNLGEVTNAQQVLDYYRDPKNKDVQTPTYYNKSGAPGQATPVPGSETVAPTGTLHPDVSLVDDIKKRFGDADFGLDPATRTMLGGDAPLGQTLAPITNIPSAAAALAKTVLSGGLAGAQVLGDQADRLTRGLGLDVVLPGFGKPLAPGEILGEPLSYPMLGAESVGVASEASKFKEAFQAASDVPEAAAPAVYKSAATKAREAAAEELRPRAGEVVRQYEDVPPKPAVAPEDQAAAKAFTDRYAAPQEITPEAVARKAAADDFVKRYNPDGEAKTLPEKPVTTPGGLPVAADEAAQSTQTSAMTKFTDALNEAVQLSPAQKVAISEDRSNKSRALLSTSKADGGEAGSYEDLAKLKGTATKPTFAPIREQLSQPEIDEIYNEINKVHTGFERTNAHTAIRKVLNGAVPSDSELDLLSEAFPADTMKAIINKVNTQKGLPEDWLTSYHYASMLSGYHSLLHNVVGHFFGSVLNNTADLLGSTAASAMKAAGMGIGEAKTLSDFRDRMYGYGNVLTNSSLYKDTLASFKNSQVKNDQGLATWSKGPQLPGVLTFPERLHSASYTFFGEAEKAANLYQQAAKKARTEGLTGQELQDRITSLVASPPKAMAEQALADANAVRFMGKGDLSDMLRKFVAAPEPDKYLARLTRFGLQNVAPFAGIAEQKFLSVVRYLPILDRLDPYARAQWKEGIQGKQMVAARYMMAATALGFAFSHDDKKDLGGDLVAEIPVLNLIQTMRDGATKYHALTKTSSDSEIKDASEAALSAISVFASKMQEDTFMKSVGDYFVARSKGDVKAARNFWGHQAQAWVPFSAAGREITTDLTDGRKRDISDPTTTGTIVNAAKAITPGLSNSLPANRVAENVQKMKDQGATPEEVTQYLKSERKRK